MIWWVYLLIFTLVYTTNAAVYGNSGRTDWTQVVARFPYGTWDGSCDLLTLRYLPDKCTQMLRENATAAEYLACNIISSPNTLGTFPFGMYPTATPLDTPMSQVTTMSVTNVFSDCALAQMIEDGCFSFRALTDEAKYTVTKYATSDEYVSQVSKTFGVDVSASASYGAISARASYSKQNKQASSVSMTSKTSGCSQSWTNAVGTLSMATCAIRGNMEKYLSLPYIAKWKAIENMNSNQLLNDREHFPSLMNDGFYVPISFDYAVQYSASVTSTYEMTSTLTSNDMSSSISAGLSVSFMGASASLSMSMSHAIDQSASTQHVNSFSTGIDAAYGECDFEKMTRGNVSAWTDVLSKCANDVANNLESLQQPARVSHGGFLHIFSILSNSGITLPPASQLQHAMNIYMSYCECEQPWQTIYEVNNNRFFCYFGNGEPSVEGHCNPHYVCGSAFFFANDSTSTYCIQSK